MRVPDFLLLPFVLFALTGLSLAAGGGAPPAMLPQTFGGWQLSKSAQFSANPDVADPTNAALLKEYGFTDFEGATYTRSDGRKLTIRAARFEDTSGAYGAFTFYQLPQMLPEQIGDQGLSLNERILFYKGNILIDAVFQHLSEMSAAELRELAGDLPRPSGPSENLPGLPGYLPKQAYVKNSTKYIVGPAGLDATGAPLASQYVDFSKGAEAVLAKYNISGNQTTLLLVSYPTPQLASAQFKQLAAAKQAHQLGDIAVFLKRTGPILAVAVGAGSEADAKSLLSMVNYDADVTWNQNTYFTRRDNAANLIVGVILLAAIVCGFSILVGVAFGGFRVAIKRFLPGKVFDRPEQLEIIALNLSERPEKPSEADVSSSIKAG
ncbi:MAG TPA: DUF6599 family protein [Terriglobales bacterium]|jgi:hypothetical protein